MTKPIYTVREYKEYSALINGRLMGKERTSTKRLHKQVPHINTHMIGKVLRLLGWKRYRRNGSSGTVYIRGDIQ